ncbi:hypothetical protein NKJ81_22535 [Mesorhizobium sp. M0018]|uniref:hypothetical protein n=1 Tax=Mesorhizobium sp. M0018 TaxID=2956844 RepID=UPI00333569EF
MAKKSHSEKNVRKGSKAVGDVASDGLATFLAPNVIELQQQVLQQMVLCQQLIAANDDALPAIRAWYMTLAAVTRTSASRAVRRFVDIPNEPDPGKRARALFPIISATVNDLDGSPNNNVKRFLIHLAWHESRRLLTRIQDPKKPGGTPGPARSFYQFEAYRAKEAVVYARQKGVADKLAKAGQISESDLKAAEAQIPADVTKPYFPSGNKIGDLLEVNDTFATYLVRIDFMHIAASIGSTNADHAAYWFAHWKVTDPDPAAVKATFEREANEVDALIVPLIKQFRSNESGKDYCLIRNNSMWDQKADGSGVTNSYVDRGTDGTYVNMDDDKKGMVEIRVPIGGGDAEQRLYRGGAGKKWTSYHGGEIAEYY